MATKDVICRTCEGTGEWKRICPRCNGSGTFWRSGIGYKQDPRPDECRRCGGLGDVDHSQCRRCDGTGVYPPTEENQRIREEQRAAGRASRATAARPSRQTEFRARTPHPTSSGPTSPRGFQGPGGVKQKEDGFPWGWIVILVLALFAVFLVVLFQSTTIDMP